MGPRAQEQNLRVRLTVAALLTGLSIAIPAVMMALVYPLNGAQYYFGDGGETWWPLVFAAIALSLGCGSAGLVLATRGRVATGGATEARRVQAPDGLVGRASWLLVVAVLALTLSPLMTFYLTPNAPHYDGITHVRTQWLSPEEVNTGLGAGLIGLGLACIALAVWGVAASDPAMTRRWLPPLSLVAAVLAILGNAYTFFLFLVIGHSL